MLEWLRRGHDEPGSKYESFLLECEQAEAAAIDRALLSIEDAMTDDPRLAMEFLSRRWRRSYGRDSVYGDGERSDGPAVEIKVYLTQGDAPSVCRRIEHDPIEVEASPSTNGVGLPAPTRGRPPEGEG